MFIFQNALIMQCASHITLFLVQPDWGSNPRPLYHDKIFMSSDMRRFGPQCQQRHLNVKYIATYPMDSRVTIQVQVLAILSWVL